jgi:hypothetical protein
MPFIVSIFTELTTDLRHCMEVCYAIHCIDFHWTHNRSTTLHGSLLCLSLYRFSLNSRQTYDIAWTSARPFTIQIFTELTTDLRHCVEVCYAFHCIDFHWTQTELRQCMQVCYAFHCIDFHRTHNRSTTLREDLLFLSRYRFSLNSQRWTTIHGSLLRRLQNSYCKRNVQYRAIFSWRSSLYRCSLFIITTCRYSVSNFIQNGQ